MSKNNIVIREINKDDNPYIEGIIKACFHEFNIPLKGTAYEDIETTQMFESYQKENEVYFVVKYNGEIVGGAGIKQLKDFNKEYCELQKMYYSPTVRGKGIGKKMLQKCLKKAKELGYKTCYLESASQLKAAIHIYESFGFQHLEEPLGNTGHFSCGIWMIKEI
ncbi:MAG: GNAT family N-acetyltransferase [Flavobacteriaceae bacterium]|nr:GNAT family N-acetyltransferase [Bacteroidia bacterium]NNL15754.1 GNAT family N-acetyltransferase [Flavobacteriaceae bacterium]